ncbi:electron transfer flavoprotein subunit beta/FixA family protein [Anaeroselena agilis]|uniref:Electron transfer flavoprotein small subunit n=1 Tax=Anaeroselena agilis TaxID=3063788 RepID=A0ABU3P0M5_9FIRM|nr:electron transfer flavoprotein subunit beta/FixA family protein [Selenomonadales bacterium 4137-cl]
MPKILVCYKWVLDEQDIRVNAADASLDFSRAKYKISDYDKNAIEEAVQLQESQGATIDAITFGGPAVKQSLKDLLSRGPDKVYYLADPAADKADGHVTAGVLAAAARTKGPYDLIICGEGSSDAYNQQVAPRMAARLGLPAITFVQSLKLEDGRIVATRKLGDCTEVVTIDGPAVVSVVPEINKPRIPSLKQVLAAAKKPSEEIKIADLGLTPAQLTPKTVSMTVKGFVMNRKNILFKEPAQADNVAKLVAALAKEGVC